MLASASVALVASVVIAVVAAFEMLASEALALVVSVVIAIASEASSASAL